VDDDDSGLLLLCRVQALRCALPVDCVLETMRLLPVDPLPGTPPFLLGLSLIRGQPVPVVDAARLLDVEAAGAARLVLLKTGERRVALLVDDVLGIRAFPYGVLHELPPLFKEPATGIVSAIGNLDASLLVVLQGARLVPLDVWARLDAVREGA